jgi:hypothetical protein
VKNPAVQARNNTALRATAADPAAHRAYLLKASLIDSVRKAQPEGSAQGSIIPA